MYMYMRFEKYVLIKCMFNMVMQVSVYLLQKVWLILSFSAHSLIVS